MGGEGRGWEKGRRWSMILAWYLHVTSHVVRATWEPHSSLTISLPALIRIQLSACILLDSMCLSFYKRSSPYMASQTGERKEKDTAAASKHEDAASPQMPMIAVTAQKSAMNEQTHPSNSPFLSTDEDTSSPVPILKLASKLQDKRCKFVML